MTKTTLKERAVAAAAEQALNYISGDPEENLPRLLKWAEELNRGGEWAPQMKVLRGVLEEKGIWYQYVLDLFWDIDRDVLKTTFRNFFIHAALLGYPKQRRLEEELDCNIPWTLLIDPTSACNLHCTGCWAAEYGNHLNLTYEELDHVIRQAKPLFTLDFWNDGEYAGGCLAGGRRYLHINANGDMEPCAFIHYSDSNIRNKKLLEALQSPLFLAYRRGQPFNENHLRPCPLLDNPGALTEAVQTAGAHSTDLQDPEEVTELSEKCRSAAMAWAPVSDALWSASSVSGPDMKGV